MNSDQIRQLHLLDELHSAQGLLVQGFGALQEIDTGNRFYHVPHQLIASGLERLMKCFISVVYQGRHGVFPDKDFMKRLGHDLDALSSTIWQDYYGGQGRPLVQTELDFLTADPHVTDMVSILSRFGKLGRYYNLDIVAGSPGDPIDPEREWKDLEARIESPLPYAADMERLQRDYYPRVNSLIVGRLERLVRAIALQFTLGDHADPKGNIRQASTMFADFLRMESSEIGTRDYRRSVASLQQAEEHWCKRSDVDIANDGHPRRVVEKSGFDGDWPFRADRVTLEYIESTFAVASLDGYAYALNGAARSHYKLPDVHDAGVAILGKSIGPFISMARELVP